MPDADAAAPAETETPTPPLPKGCRCLARAVLMLAAPVLFLLLLEGTLRLAGIGYPTSFWVRNTGGQGLTTNLRFGWRYFPPRVSRWPRPQVVLPEKSVGSLRVLVLGESAAFGTPSELYGFQRIMQAQLEHLFPGRKVEVLNGAMTAINSHSILDIARDSSAKIKPDWVVIYMGNNEVVGPFGGGSVFGHFSKSRALVRATLALESTAIAQGFNQLTDPAGTEGGKFTKWEGMANFTGQEVPAWDPRMPTIYRQFQANLRDIIRLSEKGGAKVLLCTVPVNLRDCPPFASPHSPDFPGAKSAEFDKLLADGAAAMDARDPVAAGAQFQKALELDPQHALANWLRGQGLLGGMAMPGTAVPSEGEKAQVLACLEKARDLDALRFRCDTKLNALIKKAAADDPKIHFLDLERLANEEAGPALAAGSDLFYEHVHPTFWGNYLFGSRLAELIQEVETKGRAGDDISSRKLSKVVAPMPLDLCYWFLAYGSLEQRRVKGSMVEGLLSQPPFTLQWRHEQRYQQQLVAWEKEKAALGDGQAVKDSLLGAEGAFANRPDDLYVRESLLRQYQQFPDGVAQAVEQARYLVGLIPGDYLMHTELANLLRRQGKTVEARQEYLTALKLNPYYYVARNNLEVLNQGPGTAAEEAKTP